MKVKVESEKVGLKVNIQKTKIMASNPITSWEIDGETMETVSDFIFLGSKNMPANLENSAVATGLEKLSFHSNPNERQYQRMFKLPHNTVEFISHTSKVMFKILQARLQQYVNRELPDL